MKNYITCISKKNKEALLYCTLALVVIVIACLVLLWGNSAGANNTENMNATDSIRQPPGHSAGGYPRKRL